MLSLVLGCCPTLIKKIEDICPGSRQTIEIYNTASRLLERLAAPDLPPADAVFLDIDGISRSAAARVIRKARSADSPVLTVALTRRQSVPPGEAADFVLEVPGDLGRLPEILAAGDRAVRDVVTRGELERKLADAQRKMQIVLDELAEGVAVIDPSGTIVRANKRLLDILGAPDASALLGRPCHRALWGSAKLCDNCPKLTRAGAAEESRALRIGDRALHVDVCARVLSDGGVIETIRDATPRLQLQESLLESEKMKAVGLIAAGLAHELCNPIAIMSTNAEYCLKILNDEDLESACVSILSAARQAEKVIRDLLKFAAPGPICFETLSLDDLLRATAGMVAAQCKSQQVKLVVDLPCPLPPINADRSRLQQALLNFMFNGIEAMEHGGTLTIAAQLLGRTAVEIRIADTGRGMTHEQRERAFEPFFTSKRRGVGLGMPNARRAVTAHQGEVTLDSAPGKGTTVKVILPAAEPMDSITAEIA